MRLKDKANRPSRVMLFLNIDQVPLDVLECFLLSLLTIAIYFCRQIKALLSFCKAKKLAHEGLVFDPIRIFLNHPRIEERRG